MTTATIHERPSAPAPLFVRPATPNAELRASADEVAFLQVRDRRVLAIDGQGAPDSAEFPAAIGALYPVAYGLHFALKRRGIDGRVGPLEGLWWASDDLPPGATMPEAGATPGWSWTLLIGLPDGATGADVAEAIATAARKRPSAALDRLRVITLSERRVAQTLHVGPYALEAATIERLHRAIAAAGLRPVSRHHEIYLGDPRRAAPERLRTLIRQPVAGP